jgi:uncharacterized protein (DUF3084 family)
VFLLLQKQQQVQQITENVRRRSLENQEKDRFHEQEIKKLRQQLNELIEERERCRTQHDALFKFFV